MRRMRRSVVVALMVFHHTKRVGKNFHPPELKWYEGEGVQRFWTPDNSTTLRGAGQLASLLLCHH